MYAIFSQKYINVLILRLAQKVKTLIVTKQGPDKTIAAKNWKILRFKPILCSFRDMVFCKGQTYETYGSSILEEIFLTTDRLTCIYYQ